MSLQTKVFTYGSLSSKVFKYYALELTLTENSVSQDNNTSEIAYTLKLKTGANNQFSGIFNCVLKLNGSQVASAEKQQMFAYNKTFTLLSGTTTVVHGSDGSLNMPIAVVVDTAESNSYSPDDVTIDWSWELTTIPRASSITSAAAVTLGNACNVKWTPNSKSFRYKLKFTIGSWKYTTGAIHPNKTSAYTYTGYKLPLDIANQIPDNTKGTVNVTLYTYPDSSCEKNIGTDSKEFTVTVPNNADTQPTVTMKLTPVSPENFAGLYVQKLSKVKATALSATAQYGAEIKSTYLSVESKNYPDPYQSSVLENAGEIEIKGYAKDTRGIIGTEKQEIQVLPYYTPKLTANAYRCTSDGEPADNGEYLRIKATRDYAPVMFKNVQKNFCEIKYSYKAETATDWTDEKIILAANVTENTVVTGPLLNATFRKDTAYTVRIIAIDTAGKKSPPVTVNIPSERVFRHKRAGGKGMGLGGYCEEDDLLDVHWNLHVRKDLKVDGSLSVGGKSLLDRIYPVGSIYMSVTACKPGELFGGTWVQLKDRFLLAAGDTYAGGKTGGEAEVKLEVKHMPSHTHKPTTAASPDPDYPYAFQTITAVASSHTSRQTVAKGSDYYANVGTPDNANYISAVSATAATGDGLAHNNMPPYLTVYMYKRTA